MIEINRKSTKIEWLSLSIHEKIKNKKETKIQIYQLIRIHFWNSFILKDVNTYNYVYKFIRKTTINFLRITNEWIIGKYKNGNH